MNSVTASRAAFLTLASLAASVAPDGAPSVVDLGTRLGDADPYWGPSFGDLEPRPGDLGPKGGVPWEGERMAASRSSVMRLTKELLPPRGLSLLSDPPPVPNPTAFPPLAPLTVPTVSPFALTPFIPAPGPVTAPVTVVVLRTARGPRLSREALELVASRACAPAAVAAYLESPSESLGMLLGAGRASGRGPPLSEKFPDSKSATLASTSVLRRTPGESPGGAPGGCSTGVLKLSGPPLGTPPPMPLGVALGVP